MTMPKVQIMAHSDSTVCLSPEWDDSNGRPMRWPFASCTSADYANAVVRAVNNHESLFKALRDLLVRAEAELADPEDVWEVHAAHQALNKALSHA